MRITRKQLRRLVKEELAHAHNIVTEAVPIPRESTTKAGKLLSQVLAGRMTATDALSKLTSDDRDPGVWGVDDAIPELEAMASAETIRTDAVSSDPDIAHLVRPDGPGWDDLTPAGQQRIRKLRSTQAASRSDLKRSEIKDLQKAMLAAAGLEVGSREARRALGCRSSSEKYCPDGSFGRKSVKLWNLLSSEKVSSVSDINNMHRADTLDPAVEKLVGDADQLRAKFSRSRSRPKSGRDSYDAQDESLLKAVNAFANEALDVLADIGLPIKEMQAVFTDLKNLKLQVKNYYDAIIIQPGWLEDDPSLTDDPDYVGIQQKYNALMLIGDKIEKIDYWFDKNGVELGTKGHEYLDDARRRAADNRSILRYIAKGEV